MSGVSSLPIASSSPTSSAIALYARRSADFDAKVAHAVSVLRAAAGEQFQDQQRQRSLKSVLSGHAQ